MRSLAVAGVACLGLALAAPAGASTGGGSFLEPVLVLHTFTSAAHHTHFGWAVSELGDPAAAGGADAIVGEPYRGPNARGRAWVFDTQSGALRFTFDGQPGDLAGFAIADAGDVDGDGVHDVIVGAPGSHGGTTAGHAYLLDGATGGLMRTLTGPDVGDLFGWAVASAGDVDGDGVADVLVGAPGHGSGHAYVYSGATGALIRVLKHGNSGDTFGSATDWTADVNGDGVPDQLVGARDAGPGKRGKAYVFSGADGHLLLQLSASPQGAAFGSFFVAGVGDVDGDLVPDVYVGDYADSTAGPYAGRATVFSGATGQPIHSWLGAAAGDGLGPGREAGDVNGDGRPDLVIGSWRSSAGAPKAGRVQVFSGADGSLLRTITSLTPREELGFDAVGIGDVDGDGLPDLLVSAALGNRVYVIAGAPPG